MSIAFVVPYLADYRALGFPKFYDHRCDFSVLASRWIHAAECGGIPLVDNYPFEDDPTIHFVYDYFLLPHEVWGRCLPDPPRQDNIIVFSDCVSLRMWQVKSARSKIQCEYNPFIPNYLKPFSKDHLYVNKIISGYNNPNLFCVPLGAPHSLCDKPYRKAKTLILDEPHKVAMQDFNQKDRQHVFSYRKSMDICKILQQRGWMIKTFFTRDRQDLHKEVLKEYDSFDVMYAGRWKPYLEMLETYRQGPLFFDHYQETHGFAVYENLQMGNGCIVFGENFNPLTVRQFQNGVVLSLYMSDEICADMIEEYFEMYDEERARQIKNDAYERFAAETFVARLIDVLHQTTQAQPAIYG